jgi:hypothetical protein
MQPETPPAPAAVQSDAAAGRRTDIAPREPEIEGPAGPEPTRFGDWERKGRCIDF